MKQRIALIAMTTFCLAAEAYAGVSTAQGKVVDADGQPVVGAAITFTMTSPPKTPYEIKTDKRGAFWIPNLLYAPPGMWEVRIQAEGYYTGKVKVVSRAADKTLIGEFEGKIHVGGAPLEVKIVGLGEATLDFTLSKEQEKTVAEKPKSEDPWDVARARVQNNDFAGSLPYLQQAVEAAPDDADRRQLYAYALFRVDKYPEAEAQANKAVAIAPDRPGGNLILAEIYKEKGDDAKAWEAIGKERKLAPDNVHVLERVAGLAAEMGRIDDAIEANEALTRLKPDLADAWISLGTLYAQKNEHEKSEQAFRKVVELDPANAAQTFYNIGAVLANKPNLSDADNRKAIEAFRKALELKPDYAVPHRELAFALLRTGDGDGARKELEKYLQLSPSASDAAEIQATVKSLTKKK